MQKKYQLAALDPTVQVVLKKVNTFCLWLGGAGAVGTSLVGNFQETSVVRHCLILLLLLLQVSIHFLGASLCFGSGTCYLWTQVLVPQTY